MHQVNLNLIINIINKIFYKTIYSKTKNKKLKIVYDVFT